MTDEQLKALIAKNAAINIKLMESIITAIIPLFEVKAVIANGLAAIAIPENEWEHLKWIAKPLLPGDIKSYAAYNKRLKAK